MKFAAPGGVVYAAFVITGLGAPGSEYGRVQGTVPTVRASSISTYKSRSGGSATESKRRHLAHHGAGHATPPPPLQAERPPMNDEGMITFEFLLPPLPDKQPHMKGGGGVNFDFPEHAHTHQNQQQFQGTHQNQQKFKGPEEEETYNGLPIPPYDPYYTPPRPTAYPKPKPYFPAPSGTDNPTVRLFSGVLPQYCPTIIQVFSRFVFIYFFLLIHSRIPHPIQHTIRRYVSSFSC